MKKILTSLSIMVMSGVAASDANSAIGMNPASAITDSEISNLNNVEAAYQVWTNGAAVHPPATIMRAASVLSDYIERVKILTEGKNISKLSSVDLSHFERAPGVSVPLSGDIWLQNPLSQIVRAVVQLTRRVPLNFDNYESMLPYNTIVEVMNFNDPERISRTFSDQCVTFSINTPAQMSNEAYSHYIKCFNNILGSGLVNMLTLYGDQYSGAFLQNARLSSNKLEKLTCCSNGASDLVIPEKCFAAPAVMPLLKYLVFDHVQFSDAGSVFKFIERNGVPDVSVRFIYTNLLEKCIQDTRIYDYMRHAPVECISIDDELFDISKAIAIRNLPNTTKRVYINNVPNETSFFSAAYIIMAYNPGVRVVSLNPFGICELGDQGAARDIDPESMKSLAYIVALRPEIRKLMIESTDLLVETLKPVHEKRTIDERLRAAITMYDQTLSADELEHQVRWMKATSALWDTIKDSTRSPNGYSRFQQFWYPISMFAHVIRSTSNFADKQASLQARTEIFWREYSNFYRQMVARNARELDLGDDEKIKVLLVPQAKQTIEQSLTNTSDNGQTDARGARELDLGEDLSLPSQKKMLIDPYLGNTGTMATYRMNLFTVEDLNGGVFDSFSDYIRSSVNCLNQLKNEYEAFVQRCRAGMTELQPHYSVAQIENTRSRIIADSEEMAQCKRQLEDSIAQRRSQIKEVADGLKDAMLGNIQSNLNFQQDVRFDLLRTLIAFTNPGIEEDGTQYRLEDAAGRSKGDMLSVESMTWKNEIRQLFQLTNMNSESVESCIPLNDDKEIVRKAAINTPKIVHRATEAAQKTPVLYKMITDICNDWMDNMCESAYAEYEKTEELYQMQIAQLNEMSDQLNN